MKQFFTLIACCTFGVAISQQTPEKWDLRKMVDYAMKNNISVQQTEVQARITALQHQANKLAIYPTANFNTGIGMQFGRSVDPTTNQFTTTQLLFNNFNFSTGIVLYNWGRLKNNITSSDYATKAAVADIERAANDIALNVCTYYLAALSSKQQIEIAQKQIESTTEQLINTRKKVNAGALPELNAAELESRLASDSINYFNAISNYDQNVLNLKALLNIGMATPFDIETPSLDKIPLEPLAELEPAAVLQLSLTSMPQQKVAELRNKSAAYAVKSAKANMYPTITFGGGLGTNFANSTNKIKSVTLGAGVPTGDYVTVGGTNYLIYQPSLQITQGKKSFSEMWDGYGVQLNNNFRQNLGFQINIPIFNNGSAKLNYENSKLQLRQTEIAIEQSKQKLEQDIYLAYNNAIAALQRFNASQKTVETAERTYDYAKKRYDVGLITTLDLITNQNNLLQAKLTRLNNHFDYVFRMKLLEFYKGQGLKL
ncbi:MAG: TolC family protein [Chitinophagaceae bacterium]|nr:TolC family protein [Chitinophagaceae bacterium]MCW5905515.1 TolC family protein [Chitinophagaceae bacterium]